MTSVEGRVELTAEIELHLFDIMEHYPPLGINKYFNVLNMRTYIDNLCGVNIPATQLVEWLRTYYNLEVLKEDDKMGLNEELREFFIPASWKSEAS